MLNPGRHLVGPRHVAFDPSGRYAYAVDYYAASLSVLDTTTNHTVATAPPGVLSPSSTSGGTPGLCATFPPATAGTGT